MMDLADVDLDNARSVCMTANTPLYVIRNLRSDPEIVKLHLKNTGDVILSEIEARLQVAPKEFDDHVLPLALIVALSLKQDRSLIAAAAKQKASQHRWYKLVADNLVQQVRPTSTSRVQVAALVASPTVVVSNIPRVVASFSNSHKTIDRE